MDNEIVYDREGNARVFSGTDAVHVFRAAALVSALGLLKVGITPTRGLTMRKALLMASEYTRERYKRGDVDKARADLSVWIQTMKAALPSREV